MEEFETALAALAELEEARRALFARDASGLPSHPLNVAPREALLADWQAANPKKKLPKNLEKALLEAPNAAVIIAEHSAAALKWVEENINAPRREMEARLEALAAGLTVPQSEEWIQIADVWASTYGSQGCGAAKYAEGSARQVADKADHYGLETEVVRVERFKPVNGAGRGDSFVVRAKTTPTGKEILARKPAVPLKDWLLACKRRGVNPRVYAPFLPYGIEEELGV